MTPLPLAPSSKPSAATIGLAVLLSGLMVGVAVVGWFISPARAEPDHLNGLCEGLLDIRIDALQQALNATGDEQTVQVNRAWAANELSNIEDC